MNYNNLGGDQRVQAESAQGCAVATKQKTTERRSTIHMSVGKAENGWVVSCGSNMWIAADAAKLATLMEVLAEEFQEKELHF